MSQSANIKATLNGLFKDTYASKMKDLIPDGVLLLKEIAFVQKAQQNGNQYHQPVILGQEHGITFAESDDDAFALNAAISGQIKDATVKGYPIVLRSVLGSMAASRATQAGPTAFESATKYVIANMLRSASKKLEVELLYGQVGYGAVDSVSGANVVISAAEWATGIWSGGQKMPVEIRSSAGALRGSSVIKKVTLSSRTLELESAIPGVIATDVIWHKGAYGKEFPGIHKILTNTGGLFGIDAGEYDLFKGNEYDCAGDMLSFPKLLHVDALATERGLEGKLTVLVNPRSWTDVLGDQAALRRYDGSWSRQKMENGTQKLSFFSQNGELEIIPSIYVKEGYAYGLFMEDWMRIGSSELSFKRPGFGEDFFHEMQDNFGYEMRLFADMSVFCASPAKNVLFKNIVNNQ